ncbi:MFS transporter [Streptomyces sp. ISL-12]|uniref:MFS transporter n=1 Tax=Streptomyces sp. ISL-12 TaxID=2819177 RepID=UPI001BEC99BE|nr:MFS transporter [Streptomyces sp. ISL-12]MBT2413292.1 MFS transporter [Streptomyces sp. ISL-12]
MSAFRPVRATVHGTDSRRALSMVALGSCFLVVMMDNTILNVALATIQADLSASNGELQWVLDSYILCYAALMFTAGVMADVWGHRRVLLAGLAVFTVASALAAFATTPGELVLWRAVMGVGGSVVPPVSLALINEMFDEEERARAIGVWSALGGLSIALGPLTGGMLLQHFWWGSVFLVNVPVVITCAAMLLLLVPGSRAPGRLRVDVPGVVLSAGGAGLVVYAVIHAGESGQWSGGGTLLPLGAGVVLLSALVRYERRAAAPAVDVRLLRDPAFAVGTLGLALAYFALTGGTFLMVFYAQGVRGFSPMQLGLSALPIAVGTVLAAALSGRVRDLVGVRVTVSNGLVLIGGSCLGQAFVTADTPLWIYEAVLAASGLGMGLVLGVATTAATSRVPAGQAAAGAGLSNALRQIGSALGVAVLGSAVSAAYRNTLDEVAGALPAAVRETASESLTHTFGVLDALAADPALPASLRAALPHLRTFAQDAYVDAMRLGFLIASVTVGVAVVVTARWMPEPSRPSPPAFPGRVPPPRPVPAVELSGTPHRQGS